MPYACSRFLRAALPLLLAPLAVAVAPATASAAVWGSFTAGRIAYATGPLSGTVHEGLRGYITDHGDTLADPTIELTTEYLLGIDVFYTAMLSDGTGPTAGALGTLSPDEQAALAEFIAGGGTLIITPDSNGFEGPYPSVYDSWISDYGVTDFTFVFDVGMGQPVVDHPITDNLGSYSLDGTMTFTASASGQILGTAIGGEEPFLVVFEPASGFDVGGRMLVVADHNALTNGLLGDLGNQQLAQNIVAWAAGECGNTIVESAEDCDDGNTEDGDGCDATCLSEGAGTGDTGGTGGSSSGGLDDTAGSDDSAASEDTGTPPASTGTGEITSSTGPGQTGGTGDDAPADDEGESGCSCRSDGRPSPAVLWLAVGFAVGRRRRLTRV
jgi:MYXO-CTERM domain-containing protein